MRMEHTPAGVDIRPGATVLSLRRMLRVSRLQFLLPREDGRHGPARRREPRAPLPLRPRRARPQPARLRDDGGGRRRRARSGSTGLASRTSRRAGTWRISPLQRRSDPLRRSSSWATTAASTVSTARRRTPERPPAPRRLDHATRQGLRRPGRQGLGRRAPARSPCGKLRKAPREEREGRPTGREDRVSSGCALRGTVATMLRRGRHRVERRAPARHDRGVRGRARGARAPARSAHRRASGDLGGARARALRGVAPSPGEGHPHRARRASDADRCHGGSRECTARAPATPIATWQSAPPRATPRQRSCSSRSRAPSLTFVAGRVPLTR